MNNRRLKVINGTEEILDYQWQPDPQGILRIHASAVGTPRGALLFLGPSTAGKSTIKSLLALHSKPLADDCAFLVPNDGHWGVAGADNFRTIRPLGEDKAHELETIPLQGIFHIHKSPVAALEPVTAVESCFYLTAGFFELAIQLLSDFDDRRSVFSELADVARSVTAYRLYFDLDNKFVEFLEVFLS